MCQGSGVLRRCCKISEMNAGKYSIWNAASLTSRISAWDVKMSWSQSMCPVSTVRQHSEGHETAVNLS